MNPLDEGILCVCHNVPFKKCPTFTSGQGGAMIEIKDPDFEILGTARPPKQEWFGPFPTEPWPGWVVETDLYGQRIRAFVNFAQEDLDAPEGTPTWSVARHGSSASCPWSPDVIVEIRNVLGTVIWRRR